MKYGLDNLKGAVQFARQTIVSDIFYWKPDKWFKIWFFLICHVNHKDNKLFPRGENFVTYETIADNTGATKNNIDSFMRWAKKEQMLTTRKTTRGMVVKVLNYNKYQTLDNYKTDTQTDLKPKQNRNRTDTINKNVKNEKKELHGLFENFYSLYPKKKNKQDALKAWSKLQPTKELLSSILKDVESKSASDEWTKENGRFIPYPASYLNGRRWEDEDIQTKKSIEDIFKK